MDLDLNESPIGEEVSFGEFRPDLGVAATRRRSRDLMAFALGATGALRNYGKEPWNPHPTVGIAFTAVKTALIHINIDDQFRMHVVRVHFDAVTAGQNEWADNAPRVIDWINYLNSLAPSTDPDPAHAPTPFSHSLGLTNFAFNQPHHVVFYVRNKMISYDRAFPVWFSDGLQDNVYGVKVASPNNSFFEAEVYDVAGIDSDFSDKLIHMKNYYHACENNIYRPIVNWQERYAYAININAAAQLGFGTSAVPVVIDPDTGNMGEGQP